MKILSISDVITNSSSEVFVIDYGDDPRAEAIDWDFILNAFEEDLICELCGLEFPDPEYDSENWKDFCTRNKDIIKSKLLDKELYFLEISDHDYEDMDDYRDALDEVDYIWRERRR